MSPRKAGALLGVLALLVAACGPAATAIPTATATPTPTVSGARPTATTVQATVAPTPTKAQGVTAAATPTSAPSPSPAAAKPKYGGVFRNYVIRDIRSWDLQKDPGSDYPLQYSQTAAFSRLVQWEHASADSCNNPLGLNLAESYKFVDDRTLEVKIRGDVRFHNKPPVNGRLLTADDVVFSFRRAKEVGRSGAITPYTALMEKVEATGTLTVRFYFTEPYAMAVQTLLAANMVAFVLPPEAGGPGPDKDYGNPSKTWIGTGPFMFKDHVPGVKISFTRNPDYFKPGKPYLDGLDHMIIPDPATQSASFISGKLDAQLRVPPTVVDMYRKTQPKVVISGCPYYAGFGTIWIRTDKAPFNDVRVRRALNMAIDRQAIIDTLFLGEGEILTLVPSQYGGYSLAPKDLPPELRQYIEYRPEEAKKLLAEAGFPNGFKTTLETTRSFGSPFNESQEAMIAMWAKVGIKVDPIWYETGRYSETTLQGNYDNLGWTRSQQASDPFALSSLHSKSEFGSNRSHVADPELDKIIEKYRAAFDVNDQMLYTRQIQARAVDQAYVVQQPNQLEYAALHPYVKDFGRMSHQSRSANLFERMWFDK
ncbi:MAG: ABC transporter substrate-binding protein [Chloroflexi bacterium]|nr:ABC transporter substrate-binding protein [Chloroflexota bacterium]